MSLRVRRSSDHRHRLALAVAGALMAACSSATGPTQGLSMGLLSVSSPVYATDSAGHQLIACDVRLAVHNTGSQSETWGGGEFRYYGPNDSTTPTSVVPVGSDAVWESWGARSIGPDSSQTAQWHFTAGLPFVLKIHFDAERTDGSGDSAVASVPCEPATTTGAPPKITSFAITGDSTLAPGDTLHLDYAATSSVGLWQTIIAVTGPCDTSVYYPEDRKFSVSHAVALVLPAVCALGSPLTVTATAVDAGVQAASDSLTLPPLADQTPPTVAFAVRTPYSDWEPSASALGYAFTGDSIALNDTVTDNHEIHAIYWAADSLGFLDSILVGQPAAVSWDVAIPLNTGWIGAVQIRTYATDASGNVSDTVATAPGAIDVYRTVRSRAAATNVSGDITDVMFDTKRGVLYVLQSNAYDIAVFSLASQTVVGTIPTPDYASGFDMTPSGDSIVTVLKNKAELGVVDLTQASPTLATVALPGLDATYNLLNVKVASNGDALIATQNTATGVKRLYSYDLTTGNGRLRLDGPDLSDTASGAMERSDDGTTVIVNGFANGFARYDAATDSFETPQTARLQNSDPAVDATGAHVVVAGDLYDAALRYVRTMRVAPGYEEPAAISPDGKTYYMVLGPSWAQRGIARSRVPDGAILDRIQIEMPIALIRASPDGTALAVSSGGSIVVIELSQLH